MTLFKRPTNKARISYKNTRPAGKTAATLTLFLLSLIIQKTTHAKEQMLLIPFGSYLRNTNIANIRIVRGNVYLGSESMIEEVKFQPGKDILNARSCWSKGYNLKKTSDGKKLTCDKSKKRTPVNAAEFLSSSIVPYGSYLDSCTGLLQTRKGDQSYLYASCMYDGAPSLLYDYYGKFYFSQKINLANCPPGGIFSHNGHLTCSPGHAKPRTILSGSYLDQCKITGTYYEPDTGRLETLCEKQKLVLENASQCLGEGKDIIVVHQSSLTQWLQSLYFGTEPQTTSLECIEKESGEVVMHTASSYLPPGDHLLTCKKAAYYPCLGENKQGLMVAECADICGHFIETMLEDTNKNCRISELSYISNKEGELTCKPGSKFNVNKTGIPNLLDHFQCNQ